MSGRDRQEPSGFALIAGSTVALIASGCSAGDGDSPDEGTETTAAAEAPTRQAALTVIAGAESMYPDAAGSASSPSMRGRSWNRKSWA
ncbi:hypothetical protein [Glycomyces tenuis]|uniref:hypothetical protein n=1 Tax=Glycomyces tenuis TaxID=58116 RepID=UPI00040636FA|nr:hypothetical protein [Glycomyces tenuis]